MNLANPSIPKKCAGFVAEQMDAEIVLFHPAKNIIIHTNETAALIWQMCDGINTIEKIIEILSGAYPNAHAQIAKEVPETIQKFRVQGVLDGG